MGSPFPRRPTHDEHAVDIEVARRLAARDAAIGEAAELELARRARACYAELVQLAEALSKRGYSCHISARRIDSSFPISELSEPAFMRVIKL